MEKRSIITDFSKTERVLVLIDLSPLLHLHHPNPNLYITPLLKSIQILFSHLSSVSSSSLSSFKFFFSSSPFLSTSKLPINLTNSLSFDRPSNTLRSLSTALNSLTDPISSSWCGSESSPASSRGSNIASALKQILRDYAWDYQLEEDDFCSVGEVSCNAVANPSFVRSNLIVLFSPFGEQLRCLSEFVGLDSNDENLVNPDVFCEMFSGIFGNVNCAFMSKDVHLSWVDVKFELGGTEEKFGVDESDVKLGFLEKGVKSLGWGFCSTESIILGSAIVPFGLIYPLIGVLPHRFRARDNFKKLIVQLNLQISDVNGNPIECRCCDLNFVGLKILPANRCDDVWQGHDDQRKTFWDRFGDGVTNFFIKAVQRYNEPMKVEGGLLDIVLVNGFSEKSGKERNLKSKYREFFADMVLKKLILETGGCSQSTLQPIWPIVLSYLYSEGYCGVVSITNENGDSYEGLLKPFTIHSAFLFVIDKKLNPQNMLYLQTEINPTSNYMMRDEDGKKKNKHSSRFYKDLTWHTFRSMATDQLNLNLDLGGIYFAKECTNSKKLKFLKCWMNQMKKSKCEGLYIPYRSKLNVDILKEREQRLTQPENELAISSSASAGEDAPTEASRVLDAAALDTFSGTLDVFFNNLSERINDALESKGVDLAALAERLVSSAIYWLYQKHEKDTCSGMIADKLMTLVLREPKELGKHKKCNDLSSVASDPRTPAIVSETETTAREYELQILFRMEILRSEISMSIEESVKHKFLKQICVLLEKIQCHHDGGFFGDWCLDNYVDRTIKNRYSATLEDMVNKIYKKMDLLPFADEDESANPLLNSEDSSQSCRDKQEKEDTGENDIPHNIVKADEFFQGIKEEEHACRLIQAQNRRERARRFASFTSWAPDLRRVWAPKQMKPPVSDSSSQHKISNKKRRRVNNFDSVCETPITKNDHCEEKNSNYGINSCKPVSKVLFRD